MNHQSIALAQNHKAANSFPSTFAASKRATEYRKKIQSFPYHPLVFPLRRPLTFDRCCPHARATVPNDGPLYWSDVGPTSSMTKARSARSLAVPTPTTWNQPTTWGEGLHKPAARIATPKAESKQFSPQRMSRLRSFDSDLMGSFNGDLETQAFIAREDDFTFRVHAR